MLLLWGTIYVSCFAFDILSFLRSSSPILSAHRVPNVSYCARIDQMHSVRIVWLFVFQCFGHSSAAVAAPKMKRKIAWLMAGMAKRHFTLRTAHTKWNKSIVHGSMLTLNFWLCFDFAFLQDGPTRTMDDMSNFRRPIVRQDTQSEMPIDKLQNAKNGTKNVCTSNGAGLLR